MDEKTYKEKYEALVFFLDHQYNASFCSFKGLLQIIESKNEPYVEFFRKEFDKYQERARVVAALAEDLAFELDIDKIRAELADQDESLFKQ